MGGIVGDVIGGVGSIFGANDAKKQALAGYHYLENTTGTSYLPTGEAANKQASDLLTGNSAAARQAFGNYMNSAGYKFMLGQGTNAINANAASRGILNSGSTAKALQRYGTGLASTYFNDYLKNLTGLSEQGLQAAGQIGQAGTEGGQTAAKAAAGGDSGLFGSLTDLAGLFL